MLRPKVKPPWRKHPEIPSGARLYVVGDIHGSAGALRDVLARIDADSATAGRNKNIGEIFLGDYVDRGPSSREVFELLIERQEQGGVALLKGNHETMFMDFFRTPQSLAQWRQNGGLQTLISYGLKPSLNPNFEEQRELAENLARVVPRAHRNLIDKMPMTLTCGDYFFVHAGVRPGVPLDKQEEADLLWIREDFLFHERDFEKVIVHGHTPVREPELHLNRINLDVGAYATGRLACMVIDGPTIDFI